MTAVKRLVLVALALSGCDGHHVVGRQLLPESSKCCYDTIAKQKVSSCQGLSTCFCSPQLCRSGQSCQDLRDCPPPGVPCQICDDGSVACPTAGCWRGQCGADINSCPPRLCSSDSGCPQIDVCIRCPGDTCARYQSRCSNGHCEISPPICPAQCETSSGDPSGGCTAPDSCEPCEDGSFSCAEARCRQSQCVVSYPPCSERLCASDGDCPTVGECQQCRDGSSVCPHTWCQGERCRVAFPTCPPPQCQIAADCPDPTQSCMECPMDGLSCPIPVCVSGQCGVAFTDCPGPEEPD